MANQNAKQKQQHPEDSANGLTQPENPNSVGLQLKIRLVVHDINNNNKSIYQVQNHVGTIHTDCFKGTT